jgi:phosphatidylinositol-3-phosphatase
VRTGRIATAVVLAAVLAGACAGSDHRSSGDRRSTTTTTTSTTTTTTAGKGASTATAACGTRSAPPSRYDSVVVFSFENRRWDEVGKGFGPKLPYLHTLGSQCSWFPRWVETDPTQNSLTQYVGQVTGARQPGTVNDCTPSPRCSTTADSIFRQVRTSGRDAVNFVEGADAPCSATGNAVRHVPALYLWGADDRSFCTDQVRPLSDFDPNALPAFAFITPTTCDDGHDCSDAEVDSWARKHVQPVLASKGYRAGKVAVFIWYDEETPVPNLWITPSALAGPRPDAGAGAAATLRAWQSMLGLPCLADACAATDLRPPTRS